MRPAHALALALALAACDPAPAAPADAAPADAVSPDVGPADAVSPDVGPAAATPPPPAAEPGRHMVTVADTRQVIPGPGLPAEAPPGNSNNNLDVVRHDGRVYLAWRTAPDHFASALARIYVVSSADELTWRFESSLSLDTDLREPRFLSLHGRLFLYVARLGTNPLSFEPQGMSVTERRADGTWSALEPFYRPGFIPWRARVVRGTAYLTAYVGGENIYRFNNLPLEVEFLTTTDGRTFAGVDPGNPVVYRGGGSESDFALSDAGDLFAVIRNEAGDETGWGSKVCHAPAGQLGRWTCVSDPRKYDSPAMFWHDGEAYLIGRRNVTDTGRYDLGQRMYDRTRQTVNYQVEYSRQPKRCSLWRYVQTEHRIAFVLDLPSRGDTCFPAVMEGAAANERVVYNYSSPVDGPDQPWFLGQRGPTLIYRHVLRFEPRR
jgi:hypothetical protein